VPWKETRVLDERMKFVVAFLEGESSLSEVCRRFGVSRNTGRKWIYRYREYGPEGFYDRSRAPLRHPNATDSDVVSLLIRAKLQHPTWGPRKLAPWLKQRHPKAELPAPSTTGDILRRHGIVRPRKRVRRTAPWTQPFAECAAPNETWCIDFKGWFRTQDGIRCDPLTISDAHSRQLLCCEGMRSQNGNAVRTIMKRVFREYGLPATIRSDNGTPFASTALGGLSRLSIWWIKLGIVPERMHATLKAEAIDPPKVTIHAQQKAFDRFRKEYNEERPHESHDQNPPASIYKPSERSYPSRIRKIEYGSETIVRRVRTNGEIKWKEELIYLSEALVGEPVGLVPVNNRHWMVCFGQWTQSEQVPIFATRLGLALLPSTL